MGDKYRFWRPTVYDDFIAIVTNHNNSNNNSIHKKNNKIKKFKIIKDDNNNNNMTYSHMVDSVINKFYLLSRHLSRKFVKYII